MKIAAKIIILIKHLARESLVAMITTLPNDTVSCRIRRHAFNLLGAKISSGALIYRNVLIIGNVEMGSGSSISNNTCLNGVSAGIVIGRNVMIAPGCCVVAFNHGTKLGAGPMVSQPLIERSISIKDDVWIAANCTITAGVTIGTGAVIAANSVVISDVPSNTFFGGVPARFLKARQ